MNAIPRMVELRGLHDDVRPLELATAQRRAAMLNAVERRTPVGGMAQHLMIADLKGKVLAVRAEGDDIWLSIEGVDGEQLAGEWGRPYE